MRKNAIIRPFHIGFPFFFFLNTREFRPYFIQSVVSTCNCVDTARLEFKVFKSKAQLWLAHLRFYFWCKLYFKTDEITVHIKKKAHRSHTHPNTHTHSHTHTHTHTHTSTQRPWDCCEDCCKSTKCVCTVPPDIFDRTITNNRLLIRSLRGWRPICNRAPVRTGGSPCLLSHRRPRCRVEPRRVTSDVAQLFASAAAVMFLQKKKCPLLPQGGNKYITRCFITVTVVSSSSKYLSHLFLVSPPLIYFTDPNGFNSTHTGGHDDMLIDSLTNMQTHTRLWMLLQRIHNDLMWWLSAVSHRAESLPRLIKINVADARNGLRHKKNKKNKKKTNNLGSDKRCPPLNIFWQRHKERGEKRWRDEEKGGEHQSTY